MDQEGNGREPYQSPENIEPAASTPGCRRLAIGGFVLALIPVLSCGGWIFTSQRTRYIDRGFKLAEHRSGEFTFDAWSHAQDGIRKDGLVHVCEDAPPFSLLIAIRSETQDIRSIEIKSAKGRFASGREIDMMRRLLELNGSIVERGRGAIQDEYNAIYFEDAIPSFEEIQVELEFETRSAAGENRLHQHQFTIPKYEEHRDSLYFWDVMMSV